MDANIPPVTAEDWSRSLLALVAQALPIGCTRHYVTPPLLTALGPGEESVPQNVRFRTEGLVVGMQGGLDSGNPADYAFTEVRIQISGQEELFTTGQQPASISFLQLFGFFGPNYSPVFRRIYTGQIYSVIFKNTAPIASELELFPRLSFQLIEDPDSGS